MINCHDQPYQAASIIINQHQSACISTHLLLIVALLILLITITIMLILIIVMQCHAIAPIFLSEHESVVAKFNAMAYMVICILRVQAPATWFQLLSRFRSPPSGGGLARDFWVMFRCPAVATGPTCQVACSLLGIVAVIRCRTVSASMAVQFAPTLF